MQWLSDEETAKRQRILTRWQGGDRTQQIADDYDVRSQQIKYWLEWAKREFAPNIADTAVDRLMRRRRRMLELRNAGWSREAIADYFGVSAATVKQDLMAASAGIKRDPVVWRPPAKPLLDRLHALPDDAAGMARHALLAQAGTAMGHTVDWRLLLWKMRDTDWLCGEFLYRESDEETARRRFVQEVGVVMTLALRCPRWRQPMACRPCEPGLGGAGCGISVRIMFRRGRLRYDSLLCVARRRRSGCRGWMLGRRRRALELRNRGMCNADIGQVLGMPERLTGHLAAGGAADARRVDDPKVPALGQVSEPLLDWLGQLPVDWAGMRRQEFLIRASVAMGYPVHIRSVTRKLGAVVKLLRRSCGSRNLCGSAAVLRCFGRQFRLLRQWE